MWCLVTWFNVLVLWHNHSEPWCPIFVCLFLGLSFFISYFVSFLSPFVTIPYIGTTLVEWIWGGFGWGWPWTLFFSFLHQCYFIRHRILSDLFSFQFLHKQAKWCVAFNIFELANWLPTSKGEIVPNIFNQEVRSSADPTNMNMTWIRTWIWQTDCCPSAPSFTTIQQPQFRPRFHSMFPANGS